MLVAVAPRHAIHDATDFMASERLRPSNKFIKTNRHDQGSLDNGRLQIRGEAGKWTVERSKRFPHNDDRPQDRG